MQKFCTCGKATTQVTYGGRCGTQLIAVCNHSDTLVQALRAMAEAILAADIEEQYLSYLSDYGFSSSRRGAVPDSRVYTQVMVNGEVFYRLSTGLMGEQLRQENRARQGGDRSRRAKARSRMLRNR